MLRRALAWTPGRAGKLWSLGHGNRHSLPLSRVKIQQDGMSGRGPERSTGIQCLPHRTKAVTCAVAALGISLAKQRQSSPLRPCGCRTQASLRCTGQMAARVQQASTITHLQHGTVDPCQRQWALIWKTREALPSARGAR